MKIQGTEKVLRLIRTKVKGSKAFPLTILAPYDGRTIRALKRQGVLTVTRQGARLRASA